MNVISGHHPDATANRLHRQMREAQNLKHLEEEASTKRMNELMSIELERQSEINQLLEKQKKQERQMLIIVFAAISILLIVLVVYAISGGSG